MRWKKKVLDYFENANFEYALKQFFWEHHILKILIFFEQCLFNAKTISSHK